MNTHPRRRDQPAEYEDLAELLPAPGRPVLAQDRHRVLKEHLMRQITQEQPTSASIPPEIHKSPEHPRPRRRLALLAAPLALAAVVTLGVAVVGSTPDGTHDAPVTAAEHREAVRLLDRIATVAAARPSVRVRDGQYIYTKVRGSGDVLGMSGLGGFVQREEWHAVDGERDGLIRVDPLPSQGVSTAEPDTSRRVEASMEGVPYLTFRQLQALPTDPDVLLKKFYRDTKGVESSQEEAILENIETMLEEATLLPDLSAALYRAAARIPSIRVEDSVEDAAGRRGIGLTFRDSSTGDHTWVFDPSSLTYLGTTRTALLEIGASDRRGEAPVRS